VEATIVALLALLVLKLDLLCNLNEWIVEVILLTVPQGSFINTLLEGVESFWVDLVSR
jgi:hypothetical protein